MEQVQAMLETVKNDMSAAIIIRAAFRAGLIDASQCIQLSSDNGIVDARNYFQTTAQRTAYPRTANVPTYNSLQSALSGRG